MSGSCEPDLLDAFDTLDADRRDDVLARVSVRVTGGFIDIGEGSIGDTAGEFVAAAPR